ncbi:MAG: thioredoxin family protein [Actinobacteria bacterium QS_5_72_10]|nr:MAG: thioredoxin family protein [Actinobacteria bacterium QS_5_72_10]
MMAERSTMLALGTPAVGFALPEAHGGKVSLDDVAGHHATLVMVLCVHCPYVKHVQDELARLTSEYLDRGVGVVAINPNDVAQHPEDGPQGMRAQAQQAGFRFPYVRDDSQEVARAYGAACTPDFFVFDGQRRLAYRGRMDAASPRSDEPVDGRDLRAALEALLAGEAVPGEQLPSMGCGIKWQPGNEPA